VSKRLNLVFVLPTADHVCVLYVRRKTDTFNSRSVFTPASQKPLSGGFKIWNGFFQ